MSVIVKRITESSAPRRAPQDENVRNLVMVDKAEGPLSVQKAFLKPVEPAATSNL